MEKATFHNIVVRGVSRVVVASSFIGCLVSNVALANDSFEKKCLETLPSPKIEVLGTQEDYKINHTVSIERLHTLLTRRSYPDSFVFGMTARKTILKIDFDGEVLFDKESNMECLSPKISVQILHPEVMVYIGREFNRGTCSYDAVLGHELEHVRLYQLRLPEMQQAMQEKLNQRFLTSRIIAKRGQSKHLLGDEIDKIWMPTLKAALSKIEDEQFKVDENTEYADVNPCIAQYKNLIGLSIK